MFSAQLLQVEHRNTASCQANLIITNQMVFIIIIKHWPIEASDNSHIPEQFYAVCLECTEVVYLEINGNQFDSTETLKAIIDIIGCTSKYLLCINFQCWVLIQTKCTQSFQSQGHERKMATLLQKSHCSSENFSSHVQRGFTRRYTTLQAQWRHSVTSVNCGTHKISDLLIQLKTSAKNRNKEL